MPIVLGGGISGLSAAFYLSKNNIKDVKIFEASNRVGGWIQSSIQDGFIFEHGPRTLRPRGIAGKNTLKLIEDLKMEHLILPIKSTDAAAQNRMIYTNKRLYKLPSKFSTLFKKQPPFSKPLIYSLWKDLITPSKKISNNDEPIYDFVKRRFGSEIADYAISPLICGICGGDAKAISVKLLMKDMFEYEQKYGGVMKGMIYSLFKFNKAEEEDDDSKLSELAADENWNIYSFKGGLEVLPKCLAEHLKEKHVELNLGAHVTHINFFPDHAKVVINGDLEIKTDKIISSLPCNRLALLLAEQHPKLSQELQQIPFVSIAVVNMQYDCELISEKGFGFLVPPQENLPLLGVIFDSCCFPTPGKTVLTVMLGGRWFRQYFGMYPTDDLLYTVAEAHVTSILKLKTLPSRYVVNILDDCIPQYIVGHVDRVERIRKYISDNNLHLSICGSSYDGVAVNDSILSARKAAESYISRVL